MNRPLERSITSSLRHSSRLTRENVQRTVILARFNSTDASQTKQTLTWPDYLAVRANRRKWQNAMSIPTSAIGLFGGASYFGSLNTDPMQPILGLDPFMFYGICTAACMGFGYLLGPSLGNTIWRFTHRSYGDLIDSRDREFYQHIQKRRVDASLQSPTSPVPDYYGKEFSGIYVTIRVAEKSSRGENWFVAPIPSVASRPGQVQEEGGTTGGLSTQHSRRVVG
ncbi:TIM23 complex component [Marasmius tenuissimus]|nr:TIM23 complex component [Marasmius tenuissimus]